MGDLNARHNVWNCHINNSRGKLLYNYIQQNNCNVLFPDEPTHYPYSSNIPTTIDIAINKNITCLSGISVLHDLTSDHNPIVATLSYQNKSSMKNTQYDYKNVDWKKFNKYLKEKI